MNKCWWKSSSYGKKINFDNLEIALGNRKYPVVHSQFFYDVTQKLKDFGIFCYVWFDFCKLSSQFEFMCSSLPVNQSYNYHMKRKTNTQMNKNG